MAKDPGQDPSFQRYKTAILDCISRHSTPDLQVKCADGDMKVAGLVVAAVCPAFRGLEGRQLEDCCLVLPDVTTETLSLFLSVLCHAGSHNISVEEIRVIKKIANLLGCSVDLSQCPAASTSSPPQHPPQDRDSPEHSSQETESLSQHPESPSPDPGGRGNKTKRCTVNLAVVELDNVTDEVLSDNYSDQEGRLVCLVCYKLHGPLDHKLLRSHVRQHSKHQLEKVSISLPVIGKGGPGLRKKFLTDFELEEIYGDPGGVHLVCNKCDKQVLISDKTAFRKHLAYHNLKEKNYVYRCDKCPSVFKDPSNLKRHVENIHEKQMFRCLHCDFEDNRKRRLEDHLLNAHNDQVQCEEEPSLDKGEGSAAIADLNAANDLDDSLATFNSSESSSNVFLNKKNKSPNILQKYSYQCTGCKFRKRKMAAVEEHIKEHHSELLQDTDSPQLFIKKIALKSKDISDQTYFCRICEASFKKRTLLNQHNFKVHHIQLDTDFACDQCGIVCANLPGLKAHVRTHQTKRFLCGTCNKSFLILSQLKDHVDKGVCLPENRKCNVCSKIFSGKHHLEMHMRLHTNEKPFTCNICEKSFSQKRSLKEHLLTHNAERHFKCEICDKKFVQKNHLKYHLASQHSDVASDVAKHACPTCGKMFPFPFQLKRHQKTHVKNSVAAKEDPSQAEVQCIKCTDWFPNKEVLNQHYKDCSLELLNNLLRIPREFTSENITQISMSEEKSQEEPESLPSDSGLSVVGSVLHKLIFLNWVQFPPLPLVPDLSDPTHFTFKAADEDFDTSNISHLFISCPGGGGKIGAWYMLPRHSSGKVESLTKSDVVILYLHGNGYNRSQPHRIALYKVFLSLGYYVLSIDYRGYGDSTNISPSEETAVKDARTALAWLTSKLGDQVNIIVWGHSLGTAIASHMIAEFDLETGGSSSVSGLVLESPFNCMKDEVMTFKAAQALQTFVNIEQTLEQSDLEFKTNKWLPAVKCPVLILHAEDDNVVPYPLAASLHEETKKAGKENVRFVTFPGQLGLSHNFLYQSETVRTELTQFVVETSREPNDSVK